MKIVFLGDMLQCCTESKSVMDCKLGYQDGTGAAHGSSGFEHIAQQISLDSIPVDITPTCVDALVGCDAHA